MLIRFHKGHIDRWPNKSAVSMTPRTRQLVVSLIVSCALFMQNLNSTVIATALPAIARSLGESPLRLNMAITCYLLSLAVFIPISGWTADRFGARRVFSAAIVVFTLGSIGCGLSHSLRMLVVARIVQGMGGAMMVPVGRLVLLQHGAEIRAGAGDVLCQRAGAARPGDRAAARRLHRHLRLVALDLLHQPADRRARRRCWCASSSRTSARRRYGRSICPALSLTGIGLASLAFGFETGGRGELPLPVVAGSASAGCA